MHPGTAFSVKAAYLWQQAYAAYVGSSLGFGTEP